MTMSASALLSVLGLMATFTPALLSLMEAGEDDFATWAARQRLERIIVFRAMTVSGLVLFAAGLAGAV